MDVRDVVKAFTYTPSTPGLEIALRGTSYSIKVPRHLSEEILTVVGKLLNDHLTAELADAFQPSSDDLSV